MSLLLFSIAGTENGDLARVRAQGHAAVHLQGVPCRTVHSRHTGDLALTVQGYHGSILAGHQQSVTTWKGCQDGGWAVQAPCPQRLASAVGRQYQTAGQGRHYLGQAVAVYVDQFEVTYIAGWNGITRPQLQVVLRRALPRSLRPAFQVFGVEKAPA